MNFNFKEPPFHVCEEKGIKFYWNSMDGPSAYYVVIGKDHFYLPDKVLPDLVSPDCSTERLRSGLENIDPVIPTILKNHGLDYKDLHIALLQLSLKETDRRAHF